MKLSRLIAGIVVTVVGVIMLVIPDEIIATTTFNQTLTNTVVRYIPTMIGIGLLVSSISWSGGKGN